MGTKMSSFSAFLSPFACLPRQPHPQLRLRASFLFHSKGRGTVTLQLTLSAHSHLLILKSPRKAEALQNWIRRFPPLSVEYFRHRRHGWSLGPPNTPQDGWPRRIATQCGLSLLLLTADFVWWHCPRKLPFQDTGHSLLIPPQAP